MWDANSPAKGKISPYDDSMTFADAAVYLMATQPDLGIKNPYALDQKQFDAAVALLNQQKPLVSRVLGRLHQAGQALASGTVAQGQGWQLTANLANTNGEKVGSTKPTEGSTGWSDTWMIAKDTTNINCAYKWLNYIVSPQVNAAGRRVLRRGAVEREVLRAHREQGPLRAVPRRGRPRTGTTSGTGRRPPRTASTAAPTPRACPYEDWVAAWTKLRSS